MNQHDEGFVSLFNGRDLTGWFATPRSYGQLWPGGPTVSEVAPPGLFADDYDEQAVLHPAVWTVEDGAIVGRQDEPGSGWGGFLVSDDTYGDFELIVEANPDWPADTGIYLRKQAHTYHGIQCVVDHRQSGSIGGFYGNGIGGFHAVPFAIDARYDVEGNPVGLRADDPTSTMERFSDSKRDMLSYAAPIEDFLDVWRWRDWNELRVRVVGARPIVTTWVNGVKIAELNMAALVAPNYDADAVAALLGSRGHIAFEVHDNDTRFGERRWGTHSACRWRNVRIKQL